MLSTRHPRRSYSTLLCSLSVVLAIAVGGLATASVNLDADNFTPGATVNFEDPTIWDPTTYDSPPAPGPETAPPGPDSIFFMEDVDVTVILNDARTGLDGTLELGTFALGGDVDSMGNETQTLIIRNDVTLSGHERNSSGGINIDFSQPDTFKHRAVRIGRENSLPNLTSSATVNDFPWGIILHEAGTFTYDDTHVTVENANLEFSRDKTNSGGSLYEISGSATLSLAGNVRMSDREPVDSSNTLRNSPGSIFRVRGGSASVEIGDEFIVDSNMGLWSIETIGAGDPDGLREGSKRFGLGKSVVEFVVGNDGLNPIIVNDELFIGDLNEANPSVPKSGEIGIGFLRMKLSEPLMDDGAAEELVLFRADRLGSGIDLGGVSEVENGRFFDPDRIGFSENNVDLIPHAPLLDGRQVIADYAGATYEWTITYTDSPLDGTLTDTVVLSDLTITGTPGDLNGDTMLTDADRTALQMAIASPPTINIGDPQNLYDLNADDMVDNLDLELFNTMFLAPTGLPGDYNNDGVVNLADYAVWRNNLGAPDTVLPDGSTEDGSGIVDAGDYMTWKDNFGNSAGAAAIGAANVPEPGSWVLLSLLGMTMATCLRKRQAP